jgi:Putative prokaryotic signal transducing protein
VPLVYGPGVDDGGKPLSESRERARKIRPQYSEGPLVRVATARNQAEAEMLEGLLLEEGIPSLARRSGGFDVPDFLAAGPRDIMVPASGLDVALELLGHGQARRLPPQRHPPWMRALAVTLALTVFIAVTASVALPFLD